MAPGRVLLISTALVTAACSEDDRAPAPAAAVATPPVSATHGGALVTLPRHRAELVAHESGEVFGYLMTAGGEPLADPESALLTVTVTLDADHVRPVLLRWNPAARRYEARLRDAPVEGPADVSLVVSGRPERGSTDRLPVQPALEASGVAYAEEPEEDPDDDEALEDEAGEDEASGGGGGGSLRARARRLFGL